LGFTYHALGEYKKVIDFYQQAIAISKRYKNPSSEAESVAFSGYTYNALGDSKKAIESGLTALALYKSATKTVNSLFEGRVNYSLGFAYQSLGNSGKAIERYQQALILLKKIKDAEGLGYTLNGLAETYRNLGQQAKAIDFSMQTIALSRQSGDRLNEGNALNNLGDVASKQNQTELAILFYKQSVNIRESIRKDNHKLNKDLQQSYLNTVALSYRKLADLLLKKGRVIEALQVLDLLKVQELEDYFKSINASNRAAQGIRILDAEKVVAGRLSSFSFDKAADLNDQLAKQIKQLSKSEIDKVPDYLKQIPQGTVLLYPLIVGDRLEIILFSAKTPPLSRTVKISKAKLESLIVKYRLELRDASSQDVKESSKALYDILIKPIEAELIAAKAESILYAPDGLLRYVPIAALYDGKGWLIEKYRISNLIAYSLFDFSGNSKNQPTILAGAFGGKAGEKKYGQNGLPATIKEIQAIAKDVKIQVEFNPAQVQAYRLIGYENRLLQNQDFNNDKKDAGKIGAGHNITALYEVIPIGVTSNAKLTAIDPLKYQKPTAIATEFRNELMQVKLRYKEPKEDISKLIAQPITDSKAGYYASANLRFASAVAAFGMVLRESEYKGKLTLDIVSKLASQSKGEDKEGYRSEFIRLAEAYKQISLRPKQPIGSPDQSQCRM